MWNNYFASVYIQLFYQTVEEGFSTLEGSLIEHLRIVFAIVWIASSLQTFHPRKYSSVKKQ